MSFLRTMHQTHILQTTNKPNVRPTLWTDHQLWTARWVPEGNGVSAAHPSARQQGCTRQKTWQLPSSWHPYPLSLHLASFIMLALSPTSHRNSDRQRVKKVVWDARRKRPCATEAQKLEFWECEFWVRSDLLGGGGLPSYWASSVYAQCRCRACRWRHCAEK